MYLHLYQKVIAAVTKYHGCSCIVIVVRVNQTNSMYAQKYRNVPAAYFDTKFKTTRFKIEQRKATSL